MDSAMTDLARRAVDCDGWRWMAGMVTTSGHRLVREVVAGEGVWRAPRAVGGDPYVDLDDARYSPDLTDPATIGCLIQLAAEADGDPATKWAEIAGDCIKALEAANA